MENKPCPCGSQESYEKCCKRFHEGFSPKNALELMRSRYTAYALNLPAYIIKTTHPASPEYCDDHQLWAKKISSFSLHSKFEKLEILDFKEERSVATVTFTAHLSQNTTFTEKSYFEKIKNRWLYRSGQLVEGCSPNLITTGQIRLLPLAYYGDPILRKTAEPVLKIAEDIRKLVEEMIETMDACNGIGLAAPQVHYAIRLFVIRFPKEIENGKIQGGEIKVFINPKLSSPSAEDWKASEGCLSIPTIHAEVSRPKEITVEYTNLEGKKIKERCFGWEARVILHENDHINGVLFIDRLEKKERESLEPLLKRLYQRIHDGTEL